MFAVAIARSSASGSPKCATRPSSIVAPLRAKKLFQDSSIGRDSGNSSYYTASLNGVMVARSSSAWRLFSRFSAACYSIYGSCSRWDSGYRSARDRADHACRNESRRSFRRLTTWGRTQGRVSVGLLAPYSHFTAQSSVNFEQVRQFRCASFYACLKRGDSYATRLLRVIDDIGIMDDASY